MGIIAVYYRRHRVATSEYIHFYTPQYLSPQKNLSYSVTQQTDGTLIARNIRKVNLINPQASETGPRTVGNTDHLIFDQKYTLSTQL